MYQKHAISQRKRGGTRRNQQLHAHAASRSLGPVTSTLLLVMMIGVLSLLYLTQITKTSVYGYSINELTTQQSELLEQQQELQVEAARLQSVARIETSSVVAELEPETTVTYDR